ncbi:hypothetical protein [Leptospira adleri]|uniref:Helix-turn-helix domain-containing protein n=1 Tax=Leptospira adleri TaxID=2023186 RepID=A0A2M9YIX4_9LEPT|nr:hypothetical protein [Leptospira adleri]PJZ51492.1 hypothetical protein CH380_19590 [Leptospira adleri]PJZ61600.1 hypothetical protein CH376_12495 [Leptospira adleri]
MILFSKEQRIFHAERPERDFTIVTNVWIRDSRLSWKARGILIFLLQLPPDWAVNSEELQTHASDKKESTIAGLRELVHFGYAELVRERDPETGRIKQVWNFFETSRKPFVMAAKVSNKKAKSQDIQPTLFDSISGGVENSPGLDFPVPVDPASASPELEIPAPVKKPLLSTKDKVRMDQFLKNQILNTSREKEPPERSPKENRNRENQNWNFPVLWLESFQKVYNEEHGIAMGKPLSELKSLEWIYNTTNGDWSQVHIKLQILMQLRNEDSKFWGRQAVSPETLSKFWARLFPQDRTKQISKEKIQNKEKIRKESFKKENQTSNPPTTVFKTSRTLPKSRHECFLLWAKENKLHSASIQFYQENLDPQTYTGGKKILYEKFFNEVAPTLYEDFEDRVEELYQKEDPHYGAGRKTTCVVLHSNKDAKIEKFPLKDRSYSKCNNENGLVLVKQQEGVS